jgi:hypothetical protein
MKVKAWKEMLFFPYISNEKYLVPNFMNMVLVLPHTMHMFKLGRKEWLKGHLLRDNLKLNHGDDKFEKPCSFWTFGGQDMKWPMTILKDV